MKRILLFAHYCPNGDIADHVHYWLEKLCPFFARIVFITDCKISEHDKIKIMRTCQTIYECENHCGKFDAWKEAIICEGYESLSEYDRLILMSDACFGPVSDLENIFNQMDDGKYDFWGVADSTSKDKRGVVENLRQFVFSFSSEIVLTALFRNFWDSIKQNTNSDDITKKNVSNLIRELIGNGFKFSVYINTYYGCKPGKIDDRTSSCVEYVSGFTFLEIETFINSDNPRYLLDTVSCIGEYDIDLITKYIDNYCVPNTSLCINNKIFITGLGFIQSNRTSVARIAIHVHSYYLDILKSYLQCISEYSFVYDLFITTDSNEKKQQIHALLNDYGISQNSCRVLITGNKGRDILPWLSISEDLEKYDIVGHFHTKKTSWTQEWIGESWLRGIMASLIVPAPAIIEMLMLENEVGIVIPDAPFHYSYLSHSDTWGKNRLQCQSLWNTMKNMKYVNFDILRTPVMSYGNMFWYKPKALKPLFDLKLTDSDFPEEPLSNDGTIAHAIERLPVYIAWSGGFDFRIAVGVNDLKTTLEIKEMLKRKNSAQNFQYGKRKFNLVIKISRKILRAFKL